MDYTHLYIDIPTATEPHSVIGEANTEVVLILLVTNLVV